jgi:hypothetical protein
MTDSPYGVTPGGAWPPPGPPAGPPPVWPPAAPKQSRAPVIFSLVVALIAIAVAIGAWFRPANHEAAPPADQTTKFSDQQITDAKKAICAAHDLVNRATLAAGTQKSDDPATQLVIAVNVRLAGSLSAQYFQTKLDQFPATQEDLAAAVRQLILTNQDIALLQIANAPHDEIASNYPTLDSTDSKVSEICK